MFALTLFFVVSGYAHRGAAGIQPLATLTSKDASPAVRYAATFALGQDAASADPAVKEPAKETAATKVVPSPAPRENRDLASEASSEIEAAASAQKQDEPAPAPKPTR